MSKVIFFSSLTNHEKADSIRVIDWKILVALKRAVLMGAIEIEIKHVHRGYDGPIGCPLA